MKRSILWEWMPTVAGARLAVAAVSCGDQGIETEPEPEGEGVDDDADSPTLRANAQEGRPPSSRMAARR